MEDEQMTYEEALAFFSVIYYGQHHLPCLPKKWGYGWYIHTEHGQSLSTFDWSNLTQAVVMAHDLSYRLEIKPHGPARMKLILHKRSRDENYSKGHPTMEAAVARIRHYSKYKEWRDWKEFEKNQSFTFIK